METSLATSPNLVAYNKDVDLAVVRRDKETYPRISSTPQADAISRMIPIVYGAMLYRGQESDADFIRFTASTLVAEILSDTRYGLRHLSWFEIGMVIRDAVLGGSERPLYGVSVATLYGALVTYARGEGHDAQRRAATPTKSAESIAVDAFARRLKEEYTPF